MKKLLYAAGGLLVLALALQVRQVYAEKGLENPLYRVEKRDGLFEYRSYEGYLVAEVTIQGSRDQAANKGFTILANYIFGGNQSRQDPERSEKLAMTAPVTQLPTGQDEWRIRFMMPTKYTLESLPVAKDDRIRFFRAEPARFLALSFSGAWAEHELVVHKERLLTYARDRSLKVEGEPFYAFYNSPFVAPQLRRNEVLIKLAPSI
ncbi:heme-binding protein [bacterium]|nr:heme-binding protein [bacterium]